MMKHDPYSLTELIRSDDFIAWVLHPDAMSDLRWKLFLDENPEKQATIESAREYVLLLAKDTGRDIPSSDQSDKMWRAVESQMSEGKIEVAESGRIVSGWRWIRVAASAAIILSIGSVSYWFYYKAGGANNDIAVSEEINKGGTNLIQKFNDTDKPMTILLADGSSVVLQPGGQLSYAENLAQNRREVTLTGKAFFEIVKNKKKPFLVYSYGLATKVLGTSFLIDASKNNKDLKVEVRTGTVAVFSINNLSEKNRQEIANKPVLEGITLSHDQKIAFSRENGKISKVLAADAVVAKEVSDISKQDFFFDEMPVSQVFKALEEAYNVKIDYNNELLGNCPLNATLIGQPFKDKLEVICNALDAQYVIADNQVTITGRGCK